MTDNKDKTSDQAKEIKKIQVIALKIVTRPISGMPYYEIMYIEVGKNDVNIGFGSLNFHIVLNYKEKYFELKNIDDAINDTIKKQLNVITHQEKELEDLQLRIMQRIREEYNIGR